MEQKEPSMEEILSSIRHILSKDEEVATDSTIPLDNTHTSSGNEVQSTQVVELTDDMMIPNQNATIENNQKEADMPLISEPTEKATVNTFSELSKAIEQEKIQEQTREGQSETSLEELVRSILKPYLKEWLDAHLPEIVEKVVQKEVRRVINRSDLS